ncbi:PAS domain-containing protein [Mycolicibacterium chubuense NBB4]|uniref:PAS domain-containing protein n=1 Tax=Mycolicibacterium chubuense (strain NBB4) TaxID=710421 RepID=I4BFK0_MYCCN|nr:PAS domain-containing protein [Mycolicibacterium chubuense]AFM16057.1 PAS domain-containing protein [Mycolicibacterium chubuense NBB4]
MLSDTQVSGIEKSNWFQRRWAPYLLIDRDLRIRAVNAAFEQASQQPRESLVGEMLFEAFPHNPADPDDGAARLTTSLDWVLRRGRRHCMGVQRYDIPDTTRPGAFVDKVWTPVNWPIAERGKTVGVLHHTQDVTPVLSPDGPQRSAPALADLREQAEDMHRRLTQHSFDEILAVLVQSYRVVMEKLGRPDAEQAQTLARIQLDVRPAAPGP